MNGWRRGVSGLVHGVLALGLFAAGAQAQVSIEVVASLSRDGINAGSTRQQVGIADDGTIAFGANTLLGTDRLLVAGPGSNAIDAGVSARNGSDVAINDDSIVFIYGSQVLALSRTYAGATPNVVHDCLDPATPCGGTRHVAISSDGYFAITAFDSFGGIYRGRIQNGWLKTELFPVPPVQSTITALGIDVRIGGPMLIQADYAASNAEIYGAFIEVPSRYGYFLYTSVSTRPRGGSEAPVNAVYGGYDTFALMPAQTDGLGTTLAAPALVRGANQSGRVSDVRGTPLLTLQSVAGGSMDVNEVGAAAVVATLTNGWGGLFTFNTASTSATPLPLVSYWQRFGRCFDNVMDMRVLGMNDAGQIAVWAQVQGPLGGADTQIWRVTPTPTLPSTTTYCTSIRRGPIIIWP
jgi:hypothetical protein